MPVQQQMSSFASRLGGQVAVANAEHKDKPVDTGNRRLPAGIRSGIAKLSSLYTKEQMEDGSKTPKGETFFRASAIVVSPESFNGEKIVGIPTSVVIPLCAVPAHGLRKAESFSDNWFKFQNLFKLLGVNPPNEPPVSNPNSPEAIAQGKRIEAYYFAAMKALTDPARPPVYIEFSTRGFTPKPTPQNPKPEEMVFETWHGLAQYNGEHDPAAGVTESPTEPPAEFEEPPIGQVVMPDEPADESAPEIDKADQVAALVETAMNDPEGATEEGAAASAALEDMAWANGWTKDQTAAAKDWAAIGEMCLAPPTQQSGPSAPAIGSKHKFCKRTKSGDKLKNPKTGSEFPPQEVEIVSVDVEAKTCTVKTVKDGKPVVDIRSKEPVQVKWEWLE